MPDPFESRILGLDAITPPLLMRFGGAELGFGVSRTLWRHLGLSANSYVMNLALQTDCKNSSGFSQVQFSDP